MTFVLVVCAIALLVAVHNLLVARLWHIPLEPDEIHYAITEDRWRLAISRYRGRPGGPREPVILCHGLGANRYNMDFGETQSLAKHLHHRGFDVWVAEVRGAGMSSHPRLFSRYQYGYSFDDFAWRDAPAIVEAVKRATGAPQVFWVGHSMGGIIAYVFLQGPLAASIRGMVAIASPGRFSDHPVFTLYQGWTRLASVLPAMHLEGISIAFAPYITLLPRFLSDILINTSNMDPRVIRQSLVNLTANISRGVFLQFADWMERGHMWDAALARDYTEGLKAITTPLLLLAGGGDRIVPPDAVKTVYDAVASADKTMRCFSIADGDRADYGHGDILLGVTAPGEIFPAVAAWLEARATAPDAPPTRPA